MSASASGAKLAKSTKHLNQEWRQAKESWRDAKAEEFEKIYIDPLLDSVGATVAAIEELNRIIQHARKDCE